MDEAGPEEAEDNRVVCAFQYQTKQFQRQVGVAFRAPRSRTAKDDPKKSAICIYSFIDNDQFSTLESLFVRHAPDSCYWLPASADKGSGDGFRGRSVVIVGAGLTRHYCAPHR